MEYAWCSNCRKKVPLAHATALLPCPACGANGYLTVVGDADEESLPDKAERMMCIGRWCDAMSALDECRRRGLISAADFNLSRANLEWRRKGALVALALASGSGMPLDDFRGELERLFDPYLTEWLITSYRLIRIVLAAGGFVVEMVPDGEEET